MADAQRKLIYVGRVVPGSTHDFTLLKQQLPPEKAWFSGLTVRVDSGFQGFAKTYASGKLFLPTKKPRGGKLTKNHKFRNTQQARKRVLVEHSIGGLKRYRILSDRLRMHNLDQFDIALEVCAGLWNFCLTR
ncbi:MAG: transposase family protein [Janthinobacterium lividum]